MMHDDVFETINTFKSKLYEILKQYRKTDNYISYNKQYRVWILTLSKRWLELEKNVMIYLI